jgi:putative ABC transport system permease protein
VAVVNQALVQKYFPHDDSLGQIIRLGEKDRATPWMTIVGVVADEKHPTLYQEMSLIETPAVFRPITQDPPKSVSIAVRTIAYQAAIGGEIQRAIAAIDSSVPVNEIETMQKRMSLLLAYPRFRAALLAVFAGFALLLAAIGLHGILEQFVAQRTQEIGVRMAIGAQRRDIARLVAKHGGLPVLAGLALGLLCAMALGRYLSSLLYDVAPGDLITLMTVSLALMITAAIAMSIPASRAVRVDPMVALRHE